MRKGRREGRRGREDKREEERGRPSDLLTEGDFCVNRQHSLLSC